MRDPKEMYVGLKRDMILFAGTGFGAIMLSAEARPPWPIIKKYGGALPKNENSWIMPNDYPGNALRQNIQGSVIVAFSITEKGRAIDCVVEQSSGQPMLDQVPCRLIERRARFLPAKGANGMPIRTKGHYSVAFWIPN